MQIESIICESSVLFAFNPTTITLSNFLMNVTIGTKYYIVASHENVFYSADFLKIFNNIGGGCQDWAQLTSRLSTGILVGRKTLIPRCEYMWDMDINGQVMSKPFPKEIETFHLYRQTQSVKIHSFDNSMEILADFGSKDRPSIRNIINYKFNLPDVVLRKINKFVDINFQNTIPIVNGVAFCPIYSSLTDEMFIPFSTEYLPPETNKNIVLIDFSPVGNIQKIRLNQCIRRTPYRDDIVEIILPETATTKDKSVILVLGGRLYFVNDFYVSSERSLSFFIKDDFNNVLISNRIYKKDYDNLFTVTLSHLNYYLNQEMWNEKNYNNFIILIDNPEVKVLNTSIGDSSQYISPTYMNLFNTHTYDKYRNIFLTSSYGVPRGLLMRNINRDIVDYIKVDKRSKDILMTLPSMNVIIPDTDVGYVENHPIKTYGNKIANSGFTMKDIFIVKEVE